MSAGLFKDRMLSAGATHSTRHPDSPITHYLYRHRFTGTWYEVGMDNELTGSLVFDPPRKWSDAIVEAFDFEDMHAPEPAMVWAFRRDGQRGENEFTDDARALHLLTGANRDPAKAVESLKANPGAILHCEGGAIRYIRSTDAT